MGSKLLWTGLTLISCAGVLAGVPAVTIVGSVLMIIGLILYWLDR